MRRILIIGTTGSGKTTLARHLASRLNLPAHDLDDLYWRPGWQPAPAPEFAAAVAALAAQPAWIVSGNYQAGQPALWPRADTLIWLDYGFPRTFWQLARRTLRNIRKQQTLCNGNQETWRHALSGQSIILWLLKSYARRRREYGALFHDPAAWPNLRKIRLTAPQAAADFIAGLKPPV